MASITDKLNRASNGAAPLPTNLSAQKSIGAGSLTLVAATGWPTATAVHFLLYKLDTSNVLVPGSVTGWKGTLSGTTVSNLTLQFGTDDVYAAGTSVIAEVAATSAWADDLIAGLGNSHNADGTMITSLPLTTPKITTSINDANGNEVIKTPATSSATNEITVRNAINGAAPTIEASGSSDANVSISMKPKGTGTIQISGVKIFNGFNYTVSGCVWTADAAGSTRVASMTSGTVVINGNVLTVAAVTSRTFTASKDTYVDFADNGDGTASITYTEVTNNAASPALANSGTQANTHRNAIVVTGASNIAASTSINQGGTAPILPVVSSQTLNYGLDSLGNKINNTNPTRKIFRHVPDGNSSMTTTSASFADFTNGYSFVYKTGATAETLHVNLFVLGVLTGGAANANITLSVNGTDLSPNGYVSSSTNSTRVTVPFIVDVPANTSVTIKPRGLTDANTLSINMGSNNKPSITGFGTI